MVPHKRHSLDKNTHYETFVHRVGEPQVTVPFASLGEDLPPYGTNEPSAIVVQSSHLQLRIIDLAGGAKFAFLL